MATVVLPKEDFYEWVELIRNRRIRVVDEQQPGR
jgi:hypothetical protein